MAHTGLVRALVLYNAIKNLIRIGIFFKSSLCPLNSMAAFSGSLVMDLST